jgi:hypothetical protein
MMIAAACDTEQEAGIAAMDVSADLAYGIIKHVEQNRHHGIKCNPDGSTPEKVTH